MDFLKRSIKKRGFVNTIIYAIVSVFYYLIRLIYSKILDSIEVKNDYVLFYSTPDFYDNAFIFYKYISSKKYKIIWLINDKKSFLDDENVKTIQFSSKMHTGPTLKSLYYTSKSKYIFYTHVSPIQGISSKKEQIIINLWHGCGYKNDVKSNEKYINRNYFDYVLVPGNLFIDTKAKFFGCKKEQILPIGYPRYDVLLNENEYTKKFVTNFKKGKKLVVWMPTFRKTIDGLFPEEKSNGYDIPIMDSDDDFKSLDNICKKNNIILCIKRHPFQISYSAEKLNLSNIFFVDNDYFKNNKLELYSFLRYSDALITDYSSVAVDYLLLNKPIAFILSDYNDYLGSRGFVFENPLEYMPGYHIYTLNEFNSAIIDIANNKDIYAKQRKKIIDKMHNTCDNYCERIEKKIFSLKK